MVTRELLNSTCYKLQECPLLLLVVSSKDLEETDDGGGLEGEAVRGLARVAEHLEVPRSEGLHSAAEDLVELVRIEHPKTGQWENGVEPLPEETLCRRARMHGRSKYLTASI